MLDLFIMEPKVLLILVVLVLSCLLLWNYPDIFAILSGLNLIRWIVFREREPDDCNILVHDCDSDFPADGMDRDAGN